MLRNGLNHGLMGFSLSLLVSVAVDKVSRMHLHDVGIPYVPSISAAVTLES